MDTLDYIPYFQAIENQLAYQNNLLYSVTVVGATVIMLTLFYKILKKFFQKGEETMTPSAIVTGEMLAPILSDISDNLATLLPVGLAIMGIMIGVSLIPRIVYKFL